MVDPTFGHFIVSMTIGLSIAGLVWALSYSRLSGDSNLDKRRQVFTESFAKKKARIINAEQASNRRQAVADTLKEIEERAKSKQKLTMRVKLERAGLKITPNVFWIASIGVGAVTALLMFIVAPGINPLGYAVAAFVGAFGVPRWFVGHMTKRRQKQFTAEFANAIDVIVRGVKSGLPLNECLGIIARESPEPIRSEFQEVVEQQRVGVPLSECFDRMINRMPLSEVKFFAIVLSIQQKAGGNLSEALGNLSGVLRDRKQLLNKVKALSAEANASAMVLGSLPFVVAGLVYLFTPDYIAMMWTTKTGQFLLLCAGIWMTIGMVMMKKMINFKF